MDYHQLPTTPRIASTRKHPELLAAPPPLALHRNLRLHSVHLENWWTLWIRRHIFNVGRLHACSQVTNLAQSKKRKGISDLLTP